MELLRLTVACFLCQVGWSQGSHHVTKHAPVRSHVAASHLLDTGRKKVSRTCSAQSGAQTASKRCCASLSVPPRRTVTNATVPYRPDRPAVLSSRWAVTEWMPTIEPCHASLDARDTAIIAVAIGGGLRRAELARLEMNETEALPVISEALPDTCYAALETPGPAATPPTPPTPYTPCGAPHQHGRNALRVAAAQHQSGQHLLGHRAPPARNRRILAGQNLGDLLCHPVQQSPRRQQVPLSAKVDRFSIGLDHSSYLKWRLIPPTICEQEALRLACARSA